MSQRDRALSTAMGAGNCVAMDTSFVRDVIKLKKGDKELLFIDLHMGWYVPSKLKRLGQKWGQR